MDDKVERISELVKQLIEAAQAEAKKLNHERVGVEHYLMALVRDQSGAVSKLLRELGADASSAGKTLRRVTKKKERRGGGRMAPVKIVGFVGVIVVLLVVLVNIGDVVRNMRMREM